MLTELIFYTGIALLLTHEMDAIKRHEWRIFPGLSNLDDDIAYHIFIIFHIPLYMLLFWLLYYPSETLHYWFQICFDIFMIIHLGLHHLFKSHRKYEFTNLSSKVIINLMAFTGLVHFILLVSK